MKKLFLLATASILFGGEALAAPCTGYSATAEQTSGTGYDPAGLSPSLVQLEIEGPDDLPNGCTSAPVTIRPRGGGQIQFRRGNEVLNYEFLRSNKSSASLTTIQLNGNGRNDIVNSGRLVLDLLQIRPGQFVPAGEYLVDLELLVGDQAPQAFTLSVTVEPSIRFAADSEDGEHTINLQEISGGAEVSTEIFYRTNASLSVLATSRYGGTLEHELGPQFGRIPYSAFLSGQPLNLASPTPVEISYRSAGIQSDNLLVRVAPQPARFSGIYTDVITLTFEAH